MEGNVKEALLFEQYIELKAQFEELERQFVELTNRDDPPKKKGPKTFGSKK